MLVSRGMVVSIGRVVSRGILMLVSKEMVVSRGMLKLVRREMLMVKREMLLIVRRKGKLTVMRQMLSGL